MGKSLLTKLNKKIKFNNKPKIVVENFDNNFRDITKNYYQTDLNVKIQNKEKNEKMAIANDASENTSNSFTNTNTIKNETEMKEESKDEKNSIKKVEDCKTCVNDKQNENG